MKVNVFLSWSGEVSKQIAAELKTWLPTVVHAHPFFSDKDIVKGKAWRDELADRLRTFPIGIIVLTPENFENPSAYMMFEAGALWKPGGPDIDTSICTLLVDGVKKASVGGPLGDVQHTVFERDDFFQLIQRINQQVSADDRHSEKILQEVFDGRWPLLSDRVQKILDDSRSGSPPPEKDPNRAAMIEEVVERVRETQVQIGTLHEQLKTMQAPGAIAASEHLDFVRTMLWTLAELAMKISQEPGGIHTRVVTRCQDMLAQLERYLVTLDAPTTTPIEKALQSARIQLALITEKARATEAKEASDAAGTGQP